MRISKVKLNNYVCFYDTPEFELGPGINFVVGKNNAGKTALLDALSLRGTGEPHLSERTVPARASAYQGQRNTRFSLDLEFDREEVLRGARRHLEDMPQNYSFAIPISGSIRGEEVQSVNRFLADGFPVGCTYRGNKLSDLESKVGRLDAILGGSPDSEHPALSLSISGNLETEIRKQTRMRVSYMQRDWRSIAKSAPQYIFRFHAERQLADTGVQARNENLQSDSSNLPQVLRTLLGEDTYAWARYLLAVKRVIPEVEGIRLLQNEETTTIVIDSREPSVRRPDLAVRLKDCGTGVGQILAMLYVVITSTEPRVIIIDEPNSFLHPGAVRKLLQIFEEHDHHQYIIATHSPTAIMSVKKKRILLVTRQDEFSTVKSVNVDDNAELDSVLREVGTSRSDIFGMDSIIWVEGKTDETFYKMIMDSAGGGLPDGVKIIGLVNTGDLEDKKHARLAEKIYEKLSGGVGILPSALAFVFDGDKRPDHYAGKEESAGRTCYLKRQNYESYFLDFDGIADILSDLISGDQSKPPPQPITPDTVQTWMDENKSKDKFYRAGTKFCSDKWLEQIDGARFLTAMFKSLAHQSRIYKKVKDGEEITRRILEAKLDHFQEIVDLIQTVLPGDQAEQAVE